MYFSLLAFVEKKQKKENIGANGNVIQTSDACIKFQGNSSDSC